MGRLYGWEALLMPIRFNNKNAEKQYDSRSQKYQYLYTEFSYDPIILKEFIEVNMVGEGRYSEKFYELENLLISIVLWKMKLILTENQYKIISLVFFEGKTQAEAAEVMKNNQSSITKSLMGNVTFNLKVKDKNTYMSKHGAICKRYGGSLKKLRKALLEDEEVLDILAEMAALVNDPL